MLPLLILIRVLLLSVKSLKLSPEVRVLKHFEMLYFSNILKMSSYLANFFLALINWFYDGRKRK